MSVVTKSEIVTTFLSGFQVLTLTNPFFSSCLKHFIHIMFRSG